MNLREYRSITSSFFSRREQQCALVRSSKRNVVSEFAIFMYPWSAKADNVRWTRQKAKNLSVGSKDQKIAPELRKRLSESSLIHIAYKRIYTNALQKWPHLRSGYLFDNEWIERWGDLPPENESSVVWPRISLRKKMSPP